MGWNDDIKKIMEIIPQIELLQRDISNLKERILLVQRHESSERTYQELNVNLEQRVIELEEKLTELMKGASDGN